MSMLAVAVHGKTVSDIPRKQPGDVLLGVPSSADSVASGNPFFRLQFPGLEAVDRDYGSCSRWLHLVGTSKNRSNVHEETAIFLLDTVSIPTAKRRHLLTFGGL
jgi:hypothetical protein